MGKVIYYISENGENPVANFLDAIEKRDKAKFFRIFNNLSEYGMLSIISHIKKITGLPLWEIRILGSSNSRILYAIVVKDSILVLHGFKKKSQKTPTKELATAMLRFKQYNK